MFIFSMLFGVGSKKDLRDKYRPWGGAKMGGSMSFEHAGTSYRIERTFMATAAKDITTLWNTATGEKIALPAKTEPGQYILDISKDTFENTLFIRHGGCEVGGRCDDIITRLNNIVSTGDESFSYAEVEQRLKNAVKKYDSKARDAIIPNLEKTIEQNQAQTQEIEERIGILMGEISRSDDAAQRIKEIEKEEKKARQSEQKVTAIAETERLEAVFKSFEKCSQTEEKIEQLKEKLTFDGQLLTSFVLREKKDFSANTQYKKHHLDEEIAELEKQEKLLEQKQDSYNEQCGILNCTDEFSKVKNAGISPYKMPLFLWIICPVAVVLSGLAGYFAGGVKLCVIFSLIALIACAGLIFYFKRQTENKNIPVKRLCEILELCGCESTAQFEQKISEVGQLGVWCTTVRAQVADKKEEIKRLTKEIFEREEQTARFFAGFGPENGSFEVLENALSELNSARQAKEIYSAEAARLSAGANVSELEAEMDKNIAVIESLTEAQCSETAQFYREKCRELANEKNALVADLALRENRINQVQEYQKEIEEIKAQTELLEQKRQKAKETLANLQIADTCLKRAFEEMQKNFSPIINSRAGEILSQLTGGKYSSVMVSKTLEPSVLSEEENLTRFVPEFSAGTVDQIYLALRLAVADTIFENADFPLFLDDSLNQYDGGRQTRAVKYIAKDSRQTFWFTCRNADVTLAQENGAKILEM